MHLPNFTYDKYQVKGLYLKLDKKLILKVDELIPPQEKKESKFNIEAFKESIKIIPQYLNYFQSVKINRLKYNDDVYNISIDSRSFEIRSNEVNLSIKPSFYSKTIEFQLDNIFLKKYDTNINGFVKIDLYQNKAFFNGEILHKKILFDTKIQATKKYLDVYVQSEKVESLKFLKDFISLDKGTESWMYDRVSGDIKLNYLTLRYDFQKNELLSNFLDLDANIKNCKVNFNDKAKHVNIDNVNIKLQNGNLTFDFTNPVYNKTSLAGSSLYIQDIFKNGKSKLFLSLKTNSLLNEDIKEIVQAYNINLPLKQKNGTLDSNLNINIDLSTSETDIKGDFEIKNSKLYINSFEIDVVDANVTLDNSKVYVESEKSFILDKQLESSISEMIIDTNKQTLIANLDIKRFLIETKSKSKILDLKNQTVTLDINFKDGTYINLKELGTRIVVQNYATDVKINNIAPLVSKSDILKNSKLLNGSLHLKFLDNDEIHIDTGNIDHNLPFKLDVLKLSGVLKDDILTMENSLNNIKIYSDNKETKIDIRGLDILKEKMDLDTEENDNSSNIVFTAIDSNIILDSKKDKKILSDKFVYKIDGKDLKFTLNYKNTNINYVSKNKKANYYMKNINPEFLNTFLGKEEFILSGSIDINGKSSKQKGLYEGNLYLKDTNIKDFAALNQVILLVQNASIVANPLFSLPTIFRTIKGDIVFNGYKALDGDIKYVYNHKDEYLNLHDIKTHGAEIDFDGYAKIDIKNKTIDSKLKVIFLKDLTLVASKIPIINSIFLDDKKRFGTDVKISGDLEDPESSFFNTNYSKY